MNENVKLRFNQLLERIDALTLRERGILFLAVMVLLYVLAVKLVLGASRAEQIRLESELTSKRQQIETLDNQVQKILGETGNGPNTERQAQLTALRQKLGALDTSLGHITHNLVSPQDMAKLVEQILKKNQALEVVKIESLPVVPVGEKMNLGSALEKPLYKHGMRIQFRGTYGDAIKYLQALESLPWKMFWGEVTLQTDTYPISTVTLVVYTLSLQEGWIGV